MRRRRTIYFNDARHYYLFVFEPPMKLEDAWRPIDEAAGTAVDTFIYGANRGDGCFWPTKVGLRFGEDIRPFDHPAYWRVWYNMQSLMDRGFDPLTVLIDRAHDKGMEFIASIRMGALGGIDESYNIANGGGWLAHPEVRDTQLRMFEELVGEYPLDGIEIDLAAGGGGPNLFRPEDTEQNTPLLTEHVRNISEIARSRPSGPAVVGVRVFPVEAMNPRYGLDVRQWLKDGLVDYVAPLLYGYMTLDPDLPIEWLTTAAHEADISVYPVLMPYHDDIGSGAYHRVFPTPERVRAAAATHWDKGADGLDSWFMRWPLEGTERRVLTEVGDPDLIAEQDKQYVVLRRDENAAKIGYDAPLPIEIREPDPNKRYAIPFSIADDIEGKADRIKHVRLRINITMVMSADQLTVLLNGESLSGQQCTRDYGNPYGVYQAQWLEFELESVRPRKGNNILEISLDSRPEDMGGGIIIDQVHVFIEYGPYPSGIC